LPEGFHEWGGKSERGGVASDPDELAREESALREAVLAGNDTAWTVLYHRHVEALYAFVWHRCGRRHDRAEEMAQETWLVAVRRMKTFDPLRGTFEAWLKGIAVNVVNNHRRRWQRDDRLQSLDGDPPPPVEHRSQAGEQLSLALTALPDRYQSVLRAKYEERLSVIEIAARLRSTPKAAESLLSRARDALRRVYDGLGNDAQ
jgi:RNA polymerase sigma-70 factor, ECF subfamily